MPGNPGAPGGPGGGGGSTFPGGGGTGGPPVTGGGGGGRRNPTFLLPSGWRAWWDCNSGPILVRSAAGPTTEERTLFEVGKDPAGNAGDADRARALAADRHIVPTLRWALDPENEVDDDGRFAAQLALAKAASEARDARFLVVAARSSDLPPLVHEGAVLSLGLLRRSNPAHAFDGGLLDEARDACLAAFDDRDLPGRVRAYGAFALGLLGDQPSACTCSADRDGRRVVREIWTRLRARAPLDDDLVSALLVALSMQPPAAVPSSAVDTLRHLAAHGRLDGRARPASVRAQAVLTLARLAPESSDGVLLSLFHRKSVELDVRRAAIVALGVVAPALDPEVRADTAEALARSVGDTDPDTRGVTLVSIGRQLAADLADGSDAVLGTGADDVLVDWVRGSLQPARPFAALAVGLALRAGDPAKATRSAIAFRERAIAKLSEEGKDSLDPAIRGAFFLALGLARDADSFSLLCWFANDRRTVADLRGEACASLGLLGSTRPEALEALRSALLEKSSDELRRQAALGLSLLGDSTSTPLLIDALASGGKDHVLAQLVVAIGAVGDASAAPALVRLVRDPKTSNELRALACAGLGLLGDPETVPSLSRLGADSNYLAATDAMREAVSLL
jgi:HEAT repeat protein